MSKARGLADLGNAYSDGALSHRNLIINGGMEVAQRGTGPSTIGGTNLFLIDRFASNSTAPTGVFTVEQSTLGHSKSLKIIATTGATDLTGANYMHGFFTRLDADDLAHLNDNLNTISFDVETNWSGNLSVCVRNGAVSRSYLANVAVVSGVNKAVVTLPFENSTVDRAVGVGISITVGFCNEGSLSSSVTDEWIAGNKVTSTSSTQWAKTTGNYINVTNLQLEAGDTATPFERRNYGDVLAQCQRYYYQLKYTLTYQPIKTPCMIMSPNTLRGEWIHPVTMRTGPDFTVNGVGNFRLNNSQGHDEVCNGFTVITSRPERTEIQFNKASGNLTVGTVGYLNCQIANDAILYFDAEF